MKDNSDNMSILPNMIGTIGALGIGLIILAKMQKAINTPRTPYRLKKIIKSLESELITQTCLVNEQIIIP